MSPANSDASRLSRRTLLAALLAPTSIALLGLAASSACTPAAAPATAPTAAAKASGPTAAPAAAANAPAPTTAASAPTTAAAAPTARRASLSGTLNVGVSIEPGTLDPQFANGVTEYVVTSNVMEGLVGFGQDLSIVPVLAETYRQVDENLWEFKLRQGVKFHNGEALNAEAVKVTFERSNDPNLKIRNTWFKNLNLDEIQILDDLTLRFHTDTPTPHMLARMAKDYPIYPPKYLTQTDPKGVARKAVGTGPYIFKEWASGDRIVLEANPDYWGNPKPSVKTIVWRWIPEHTSRLANLRTGSIDVMTSLDPSAIAEVNADSQLQALALGGGRRVYVGLNTRVAPFDDVRVRQALNYGADIESICKTIFAGATQRMRTWSSPPNENPDVKGYHYDPARARQLLQEAGLGQGFSTVFDVDSGGYLKLEEFPSALVTSLRDIGVDASIKRLDDKVAQQQQRERKTSPLYLRSTTAQYDAGLDFDLMRLDHAGNATNWNDPVFQALMKQLYTGGTVEQRKAWTFEAQARVKEEAPMLFLWRQPEIYGLSKKVHGFSPNGTERFNLGAVSLG
jgi:ABC-type transport system substrate-binding protein